MRFLCLDEADLLLSGSFHEHTDSVVRHLSTRRAQAAVRTQVIATAISAPALRACCAAARVGRAARQAPSL